MSELDLATLTLYSELNFSSNFQTVPSISTSCAGAHGHCPSPHFQPQKS